MKLKRCIERVQGGLDESEEDALQSNPDYMCPTIYHHMGEKNSSDEDTSSDVEDSSSAVSLDDMCTKYNCRRRSLKECTSKQRLTDKESQLLWTDPTHVCSRGVVRGVVRRVGASSAFLGGLGLLKKYGSLDKKIEKMKRDLDLRVKQWKISEKTHSKPSKVLDAEWEDINREYSKLKELQARRPVSQIDLLKKKISDNQEEAFLRARELDLVKPDSPEFHDANERYRETAREAARLETKLAQLVSKSASNPSDVPQAAGFAGSKFLAPRSPFFHTPSTLSLGPRRAITPSSTSP
jgi:DNA repair exonuclease SbcCD ATPase subunit